jgi:hypothetical protein
VGGIANVVVASFWAKIYFLLNVNANYKFLGNEILW